MEITTSPPVILTRYDTLHDVPCRILEREVEVPESCSLQTSDEAPSWNPDSLDRLVYLLKSGNIGEHLHNMAIVTRQVTNTVY